MACKRCADCRDLDHHWLPNDDLGNDPAEAEGPTGNDYVCKHCPAVGDECSECEGYGEIEDEYAVGHTCPECDGEGIVVSVPRTFEEA